MSRDANLHPKTVSNYQEHTARRVRNHGKKVSHQMTVLRIDPRVWNLALKVANGDRSRIQILSDTAVRVVNQSKRKG